MASQVLVQGLCRWHACGSRFMCLVFWGRLCFQSLKWHFCPKLVVPVSGLRGKTLDVVRVRVRVRVPGSLKSVNGRPYNPLPFCVSLAVSLLVVNFLRHYSGSALKVCLLNWRTAGAHAPPSIPLIGKGFLHIHLPLYSVTFCIRRIVSASRINLLGA